MNNIDYFSFSIIIDDVVLPTGHTLMGVLGGGGPQTAFGMRLWSEGGVGICAGIGTDFPAEADAWLHSFRIDGEGIRRSREHRSLRAWQVLEEDGRRTQVWRSHGATIPAQLSLRPEQVPESYYHARGFHFGVHPESPNLAIVNALKARGVCTSIEPFRDSAEALPDSAVRALVGTPDIFSPNLSEAASLVGPGDPLTQLHRLADAGAHLIALRMGAEGSLLYRPAGGECWHVGAVPVAVVDPVGAGNAYCGALLVGWLEHGDLAVAGQYATVAASFLVEQYGLPQPSPRLRQQAAERLALAKVTRMELPPRGATLNREAS